MELIEAIELLEDEMEKHGLLQKGWTYGFEKPRGQKRGSELLGICVHSIQTIYISDRHVRESHRTLILDTIRHEIAHALVGEDHDHDNWWQMVAKNLGADPSPVCHSFLPEIICLPYIP